jgi:hypothetical protein
MIVDETLELGMISMLCAPRSKYSVYAYDRPGETVSGPVGDIENLVFEKLTQLKSSMDGEVMKRRSLEFQSKSRI